MTIDDSKQLLTDYFEEIDFDEVEIANLDQLSFNSSRS